MNLILDKINYLGNLCDKQTFAGANMYSHSRRHDDEVRSKNIYKMLLSIAWWMGALFIYNYKALKLFFKYLTKQKSYSFLDTFSIVC